MKENTFKKLFRHLDSSRELVIRKETMNLANLPFEIIKLLTPLFEELEEIDEGIDHQEFMEACNRLYEVSKTKIFDPFLDSRPTIKKLALKLVPLKKTKVRGAQVFIPPFVELRAETPVQAQTSRHVQQATGKKKDSQTLLG